MKRSVRLDTSKLSKLNKTPQGFIRAPVYATRTGVFTYRLGDGSVRRELRHPEDVFAAESLATLAGIPLTDDHPNVKNPDIILLDSANAKAFMIGFTGDHVSPADDIYVSATVTITDAEAIAAVEKGKHEVSCGYSCDHEEVSGVYDGEPYDVRQRNIEYNHLALVTRGRAGPSVKLRLDAADAVQVDENLLEDNPVRITLGGAEFDVSDELAAALKKELEKNWVGIGVKLDADERAERAQARADGLEVEVEKLKSALSAKTDAAPDPGQIREAAKARVRVLKVAERVLKPEKVANLDTMDDREIMIEVIKTESRKDLQLDSKSDAYIEGCFDVIKESFAGERNSSTSLGSSLHSSRTDAAANKTESDVEAARRRQREYSENAWKSQSQSPA